MIDPRVQITAGNLAISLEVADSHAAKLAAQQLVYDLGGSQSILGMDPGAVALYILSLALANRNGAIQ